MRHCIRKFFCKFILTLSACVSFSELETCHNVSDSITACNVLNKHKGENGNEMNFEIVFHHHSTYDISWWRYQVHKYVHCTIIHFPWKLNNIMKTNLKQKILVRFETETASVYKSTQEELKTNRNVHIAFDHVPICVKGNWLCKLKFS